MRFCSRCLHWKPDACYEKGTLNNQDHTGDPFFEHCTQCRGPRAESSTAPQTMGPMRVPISRETRRLILIARREAAKFMRRGGHEIPRSYTSGASQQKRWLPA